MKKFSLLLVMLMALVAPSAMNAQRLMKASDITVLQEPCPAKMFAPKSSRSDNTVQTNFVPSNRDGLSLTVYDGTVTNIYIPIFGYYADSEQVTEFIIPSSELAQLENMLITGMKFYTNYDITFDGDFYVYLEEVDGTNYSAISTMQSEAAQEVYSGVINISNNELIINFQDLYTYHGGNLLVSFYTEGCSNYAPSSNYGFYGETVSSSSVFIFDYNGQYQGNIQDFIPQTTFFYEVPGECPKPTNLTVTGVTPTTATLSWNSDESVTAWQIAYSTSEGFNPDNVTPIDVDENPYTLTNLSQETTYYAYVRAACDKLNNSTWSAMTSFTTPSECDAPFDLEVSDITYNSASISWDGYQDTYNLRYRTVVFYDDFENGLDNWTVYTEGDAITGMDGWFAYNASQLGFTNHNGGYSAVSTSWYQDDLSADNWIVTPQLDLQGTLKFWIAGLYEDEYEVLLSTRGNATTDFNEVLQTMTSVSDEWTQIVIDLSAYEGQQGYIAIHHVFTGGYWIYLDDFLIEASSEWTTINDASKPYALEGLTEETYYEVQIQGICPLGETEWSDSYFFVSATGNVFINDGNWNVAGNWKNNAVPAEGEDVTINANCIIPSGNIIIAGNITIGEGGSLTIKDGAQLIHTNEGVVATVEKAINGYTGDKDNYYLLSPSVNDETYFAYGYEILFPEDVTNMLENEYDLYAFDFSASDGKEWLNYKSESFSAMQKGFGYLYANNTDVTLSFTGVINPAPFNSIGYVSGYYLPYSEEEFDFSNWTLAGNPYLCDVYLAVLNVNTEEFSYDFYVMNGDEIAPTATGILAPMEGAFVISEAASTDVVVALAAIESKNRGRSLNLSTTQNGKLIDRAIVRFGEGNGMPKIQLNPNHTKLFFTKDNKDYAVVYSDAQNEMPVSFKAEKNGTYTISFSNENVEFGYLHLIDNMTGNDVDLLQTPSYTFTAKTTDYASRFRLVFSADSANDDIFAYYNNGSFVINNEGNATLQVIDMMGRTISTETINGNANINVNAANGVYMLRLVNGDSVKVQKVVVK